VFENATKDVYREYYGISVRVFPDGVLHKFNAASLLVTLASAVAFLVAVRSGTTCVVVLLAACHY